MNEYFEILYDSRNDENPSNIPFRIIHGIYNGEEFHLNLYKKQKEYYYDDLMIEQYIKSKKKCAYKEISNIYDQFIGDERIVYYTLENQLYNIRYDRDDEEYFKPLDEIKEELQK